MSSEKQKELYSVPTIGIVSIGADIQQLANVASGIVEMTVHKPNGSTDAKSIKLSEAFKLMQKAKKL